MAIARMLSQTRGSAAILGNTMPHRSPSQSLWQVDSDKVYIIRMIQYCNDQTGGIIALLGGHILIWWVG